MRRHRWRRRRAAVFLLTSYFSLLTAAASQSPLSRRSDRVSLAHDALHYDINIVLPATDSLLIAEVTTRWRLRGAAPLVLDFDSAMTITAATVNGRGVPWTRRGQRLTLPVSSRTGREVVTRIAYRGVAREGLVVRGLGPERTIFADNWPERARRWLPVQDHPADKASVTWRIDAPEALTLVANGGLQGTAPGGAGRRVWRFDQPEPIPVYTMVLGAARFAITRLMPAGCDTRCLGVSLYTAPEDSALAAGGPFRRASAMLDFFAKRFGEFPYGELRHVQATTNFGGMENATAIFYNQASLHEGRISEATVAHETAHQWFGDAVTQADWHHLWLSEGFASYAAALWAEYAGGDSAIRVVMAEARTKIVESAATERPVLDAGVADPAKLLNSNSYQKGSWLLHSLRGMVGDSVFFRGVARFVRTHRHGNALSGDFARIMSTEAGEDLTWYFRQALLQPGYPRLTVAAAVESNHLVLTITQVQPAGWGLYRIPNLSVRLDDRTLIVNVLGRVTRVATHWGSDRPPESLRVDPLGQWLLTVRGEK